MIFKIGKKKKKKKKKKILIIKVLKINGSLEVARSGLWAPVEAKYLSSYVVHPSSTQINLLEKCVCALRNIFLHRSNVFVH